jgi:hypothetical protein
MADLPRPEKGEQERVEPARDEAHERARKINPVYTEGELVRVAWAANQAEAELIQGMLLEAGVPSTLRRSMGFDVPDFLAAGPRDVFVPAAGFEAARALFDEAGVAPLDEDVAGPQLERGLKLTAAVVAAAGLATLVAWLLLETAR